ncbi:hypothetical protein AL542_10570 [Grimontia hollisae]|uniref:Uncharacterized protein n=1 Tax=Grimontia hollisae CIP 101886 TaxID=675812 RepID=D0I3J6_GRIHO|nr:hypothetical protein [Grimontia hollisae]AMG30758.1 hypothetical protein AL542_10570 [Grimontia hollisae]EEY74017.1 hypothetical protein VHA_000311 [Grimontia hollisae CIP 101886]STO47469.1 Uncharacterised protein [Grimontia hollisae]
MEPTAVLADPLAEIDFLAEGFMRDPYPVYQKLIAQEPVFYSERYRHYKYKGQEFVLAKHIRFEGNDYPK